MDVTELRDFYASPIGKAVEHSVFAAFSSFWPSSKGCRLVGLGYGVPFLDRFSPDCESAFALMPASQGALQWPNRKNPATALVFDEELPLADSSVDIVVMAHFLEHAENAEESLAEAWRVLSPGGKLIVLVPNRRGVWARFEHMPFGTGRPYSKGQLSGLLRSCQFTVESWSDALHFPPSKRDFVLRMKGTIEQLGRRFWPIFSGAICVCASKQLYQGIPVTARVKRKVLVPVLAPQGTGRTSPLSNLDREP